MEGQSPRRFDPCLFSAIPLAVTSRSSEISFFSRSISFSGMRAIAVLLGKSRQAESERSEQLRDRSTGLPVCWSQCKDYLVTMSPPPEIESYAAPVMPRAPSPAPDPSSGSVSCSSARTRATPRPSWPASSASHSKNRLLGNGREGPHSDILPQMAKVLGVGVEDFLGTPSQPRKSGPVGRLQRVFEMASKLPRREQDIVVTFVESLVERQKKAG